MSPARKSNHLSFPSTWQKVKDWAKHFDDHILKMNQSKIFAGLVIIVLNVSGKFANIQLSKSMESYLKYTFSRNILVFSMAWMGTRDIYVALGITAIFMICANYLFNEESPYCCLPEHFTDYHTTVADEKQTKVDQKQIDEAIQTLSKAKQQMDEEKKGEEKKVEEEKEKEKKKNASSSSPFSSSSSSSSIPYVQ